MIATSTDEQAVLTWRQTGGAEPAACETVNAGRYAVWGEEIWSWTCGHGHSAAKEMGSAAVLSMEKGTAGLVWVI